MEEVFATMSKKNKKIKRIKIKESKKHLKPKMCQNVHQEENANTFQMCVYVWGGGEGET